MSKKNAFLIHLGFSLIVFVILLLMIIYVWYPAPYFDASYRMKWIKIMAFVDLVLGPGLTLIIYKPNKPRLKLDMSVILVIQLSALSWGVFNAWSVHPRLNVYFDGQVYCLDQKELSGSADAIKFASSPMPGQLMAVLPYPDTAEKIAEYFQGPGGKTMILRLAHLYQKATPEITSKMDENQADIMTVISKSDENRRIWQEFISGYDGINKEWRYYEFNCFKGRQILVFDRAENKVEAVLNIRLPISWLLNG